MNKLLERAIGVALLGPPRQFLLGAVGRRSDGTLVASNNGGRSGERTYSAHAEARVTRKLDRGSVVYVARLLKDGTVAMAKPCRRCQAAMRARGVTTVHYTITDREYGSMEL